MIKGQAEVWATNTEGLNNEEDLEEGSPDALHCLECGATLPSDATSCTSCGNEKLILPSHWPPPSQTGTEGTKGVFSVLGKDVRMLVGMTVVLIMALWILGAARARTEALINGETGDSVEVVIANTDRDSTPTEITVIELPSEPAENPVDITELRIAAAAAGESGARYEIVAALEAVCEHPDAGFNDFMALVNSQQGIEDFDSAKATLNRICVRFPDRPEGYLMLGSLHEQQGNINAARFQYEVGVTYIPDNQQLRDALDRVNRELGIRDDEVLTSPVPEWIMPDFVEESAEPVVSLEDIFGEAASVEPVDVEEILSIPADPEPVQELIQSQDNEDESSSNNETSVITLIGSGSGSGESASDETDISDADASEGTETTAIVEIYDLRVDSTTDQVIIELFTSNPAAISTSRGTEPSRLFVRIPDARLSEGAGIARSISLNTDLVERINVVENTDSNLWVSLVVYFDQNTRQSVAADARSIRVTITRSNPEEG